MKIAINKAHFPVTVLGPGRRIGIWFQGCAIRCPGCVSQDTWTPRPDREISIAKLVSWCRETSRNALDGITLSGGEPFDQPKALSALLDALRQWNISDGLSMDILCYSGYSFNTLQQRHARLLKKLDALIPEPFVHTLPLTHLWRGSKNQPLLTLSPLGEERYAPYLEAKAEDFDKRIQIQVDGDRLWCIGIPGRDDMTRLEASVTARGIGFSEVSWR
ncbi:MAG: radical SAM protein [Candidatus Accumulibacter sp.]|jgi:anaerobic ribonucleoside-triphosphate reductase activating protein|nr:radical SAM protein [Accumulibacter sp.]